MRLLISVSDAEEAQCAIKGGADIVDVKNPHEEIFGANFPSAIQDVRMKHPDAAISVTLGALPNLPGTAALAALGAVTAGADYVKAGLLDVRTYENAIRMMQEVKRAIGNGSTKVIAAAYADYALHDGFDAHRIVDVAAETGCNGILIDTRAKGKGNLFTFMSPEELKSIVEKAHAKGLTVALSGELKAEDLPIIRSLGADIIGVRGAVCAKQDRYGGRVQEDAVARVKRCLLDMDHHTCVEGAPRREIQVSAQ